MSLAAKQSKVLLSKAPIQEQALAAQYYNADHRGLIWNQSWSQLKSNIETVEH